jgi:hypothetical protein
MSFIFISTLQFTLVIFCCLTIVPAQDPCSWNPCKHGTCRRITGGYNWGYECVCEAGYIGAQCEWDGPTCTANTKTPCDNNGKCVEGQEGRFCDCPLSTKTTIKFGGHYCEMIDPCEQCPLGYAICSSAPNRQTGVICLDARQKEMIS